ncbi:MAG TPA: GerMN domain-containing protein [Symbiobacteriaceae bacterium]|nr:GerMN domain-containing protein [Symbiobacteriaceae bacterium]
MTIRHGLLRYTRALPILLALTLVAAGCTTMQPQQAPIGETPVPPVVEVPPPVTSQAVSVFFPDWQVQHVIPEVRQVPQATGAALATQVVRELLAGPSDPHLVKPFPAGVTLLTPVTVANGLAKVNLSKEIRTLQGSAGVLAALNSLRVSLTEIEGIDRVEVQIDGQSGGELGGLVLEPMDRGLYLYPVLPNPERVKYLQQRFDQGLETWRSDALKVTQWEGRMFGFTTAELAGAKVEQKGAAATARVTRGGDVYSFKLVQNQAAGQGKGIWTIESLDPVVRHTLSALPPAVRSWAELYADTTIGVSNQVEGGRTYLLAAVEEGTVQIDSVTEKNGQLVVSVVEGGADRVAIASVEGAGLPAVFQWKTPPAGPVKTRTSPETLPILANPHKLRGAKLSGDIAVISPTSGQSVSGSIVIRGYARHLFEAGLTARLMNQQGKEVAAASTQAGACCYDWGSFDFTLKHAAPSGSYVLELGAYSPKDGEWERLIAVPVKVGG